VSEDEYKAIAGYPSAEGVYISRRELVRLHQVDAAAHALAERCEEQERTYRNVLEDEHMVAVRMGDLRALQAAVRGES
jgi:hypothetical protein